MPHNNLIMFNYVIGAYISKLKGRSESRLESAFLGAPFTYHALFICPPPNTHLNKHQISQPFHNPARTKMTLASPVSENGYPPCQDSANDDDSYDSSGSTSSDDQSDNESDDGTDSFASSCISDGRPCFPYVVGAALDATRHPSPPSPFGYGYDRKFPSYGNDCEKMSQTEYCLQ